MSGDREPAKWTSRACLPPAPSCPVDAKGISPDYHNHQEGSSSVQPVQLSRIGSKGRVVGRVERRKRRRRPKEGDDGGTAQPGDGQSRSRRSCCRAMAELKQAQGGDGEGDGQTAELIGRRCAEPFSNTHAKPSTLSQKGALRSVARTWTGCPIVQDPRSLGCTSRALPAVDQRLDPGLLAVGQIEDQGGMGGEKRDKEEARTGCERGNRPATGGRGRPNVVQRK